MLSVPSAANSLSPESQAQSGKQPNPPQRRRKLWAILAVSALLGVGAAGLVHSRTRVVGQVHSGTAGFKKSSTGKDLHWAKGGVTVYLDDSLTKLGAGADEAVMQAFSSWVASEQRLPNLSFDTVKSSSEPRHDGKSVVSYAKITAPGHEHDVAITLTYSDDQTGEIIEADVIINALYQDAVLTATNGTSDANAQGEDNKPGDAKSVAPSRKSTHTNESVDCRDRYDVQNVVTHESGHFFGLGEEMTDSAATMFYSIDQCETHKRVLKADDIQVMSQLYNATADPEEVKAGVRGCSFVGAPATGSESCWLALLAALPLLRRKRRG
jgi:hypothetical protein